MNFMHDQNLEVVCGRPDSLETQIATAIIRHYRTAHGMDNTQGPRFSVGMDDELSTRPLYTLYNIIPDDWKPVIKFFQGMTNDQNTLTIRWLDWQLECAGKPPVECIDQAIDDWFHYQEHFQQVKTRFVSFVEQNANQRTIVYSGKITQSCIQKTLENYSPNTEWLVCQHSAAIWRIYNLWRQEWGAPISGSCGHDLAVELYRSFGVEVRGARVCKGKVFVEFETLADAETLVRTLEKKRDDAGIENIVTPVA